MTRPDPFEALRAALAAPVDDPLSWRVAHVDPERLRRTGVPEIVLAEGKSDAVLAASVIELLESLPRVLVSRLATERCAALVEQLPGVTVERPYPGTTVVLARKPATRVSDAGYVAVFTAGSSDLAVAGEAATVAQELGCRVELVADVGVASLHRLVGPLRRVLAEGVDVIIVAAGMDGALPAVISGLVDVPVIGLPTSVGYGVAAGGQAALQTMLASCVPGLTVVNIDNGVGAGASAALIARRAQAHPRRNVSDAAGSAVG